LAERHSERAEEPKEDGCWWPAARAGRRRRTSSSGGAIAPDCLLPVPARFGEAGEWWTGGTVGECDCGGTVQV